jgi:hypothetical protein
MKTKTLVGLALILSSFALYGAGGFIIKSAIDEKNRIEVQKRVTETQCLRHLESIPNAKVSNTGKVTVTITPIGEPMEALTTASMAEMMCPTKDLAEVCLGDECGPDKKTVSMVLKFENTRN